MKISVDEILDYVKNETLDGYPWVSFEEENKAAERAASQGLLNSQQDSFRSLGKRKIFYSLP